MGMDRKTLPPCPDPSNSSLGKETWYLWTGQKEETAEAWLSKGADSCLPENQECVEKGTLRLDRGFQGVSGGEVG